MLVWLAIHLSGIAATLLVRMQLGRRYEGLAQLGFLFSLTGVALSTVVGYHACQQMWSLSAVTLAVMIVMAVVDFEGGGSIATNAEA